MSRIYQALQVYNSIPSKIKSADCLNTFKRQLKGYIFLYLTKSTIRRIKLKLQLKIYYTQEDTNTQNTLVNNTMINTYISNNITNLRPVNTF